MVFATTPAKEATFSSNHRRTICRKRASARKMMSLPEECARRYRIQVRLGVTNLSKPSTQGQIGSWIFRIRMEYSCKQGRRPLIEPPTLRKVIERTYARMSLLEIRDRDRISGVGATCGSECPKLFRAGSSTRNGWRQTRTESPAGIRSAATVASSQVRKVTSTSYQCPFPPCSTRHCTG